MSDINEKKDEKEYLKKVLADLAISDDTDVAEYMRIMTAVLGL